MNSPTTNRILQMVVDKRPDDVAELAKITGVSEVTIRQDHEYHGKAEAIYAVRTVSAVSLESDDVETRMMTNYALETPTGGFRAASGQSGIRFY